MEFMPEGLRAPAAWLAAAFAVFAALWTLLDPLGGSAFLESRMSKRELIYVLVVMTSLVISIPLLVHSLREINSERAERHIGATRRDVNIPSLLGRAEKSVTVVGLTIPSFATEQALRTYDDLLAHGVYIDLMFVNPVSPSLLQRSRSLYAGQPGPFVAGATSLRTLVRYRDELGPTHRGRFRVRLSDCIPAAAAVIVDGECLWHPYMPYATGVTSPYIVEPSDSGFGVYVLRYVDELKLASHSIEATTDIEVLMDYLKNDSDVSFRLTTTDLRSVKQILSA